MDTSPESPEFGPRTPPEPGPRTPPEQGPKSPDYEPKSPDYEPPKSFDYGPPKSFDYGPRSPDYVPRSPDYKPKSPDYGPPKSFDYGPRSPDYVPRSPDYKPKSPDYGPPKSFDYGPRSPDYVPRSPDYRPPKSPDYVPRSPDYGPPESPLPSVKQILVNTDKTTPIIEPASLDAIGIFYKLKGKYEHDLKKIKNKILNRDDLTIDEKRDLFQAQKPKCINCKKPGGTIFKVESERYLAMCNAEEKCKLDIKIKRGKVSQLNDYVDELKKQHENLVTEIMKIKYNLLFKYTNEEETVKSFEKKKVRIDTITTAFDLYKTKLVEISNLLSRKEAINISELQILNLLKKLKRW